MSITDRPAVVIATDGTERSPGAIRFGLEQAKLLGSEVVLVHVSPVMSEGTFALGYVPQPQMDFAPQGRATLASAEDEAHSLAPDLQIRGVHRQGDRVREVVAAAEEGAVVVLGRETRRGLDRLFTGTTTSGVAAHAAIPTVVVPADWVPAGRGLIVVAIKAQKYAPELLTRAFAIASSQGKALRVLHVWDFPVHPASGNLDSTATRREQEEWSAGVLEQWREAYPEVVVESNVVGGQPARALVDAAADADLLMLGRPQRGLQHLFHLGSTTRAILRVSDVPLEVVPLSGNVVSAPLTLESAGRALKGG